MFRALFPSKNVLSCVNNFNNKLLRREYPIVINQIQNASKSTITIQKSHLLMFNKNRNNLRQLSTEAKKT